MSKVKHCLIVDDSKMIRRVATRILKDMNFDVSEAENGKEALDLCKLNMPDAVLLDWRMPVMDGFGFLQALRKLPNGDAPIVVFCTAERSVERITEALQNGADEYIMKPFDSDIIESKFQLAGLI